jgi:RNA polymerase sigma factor (sigma-70 family)
MSTVSTTQIRDWLNRCAAGDRAARDELLTHTRSRLVALFRKCARDRFAAVRSELETDEVINDLYVRLLERWDGFVAPPAGGSGDPVRDYFGFAARVIRDILCDAIRRQYGRGKRPRARVNSLNEVGGGAEESNPGFDPSEATNDPERNAIWSEVHQYLGALPEPLRQVVDLHYYHGLTHEEVGQVLGIAEVTSRVRWSQVRHDLKRRYDLNPFES